MVSFIPLQELEVELPALGNLRETIHVFETRDLHAINAALASGRPLLVRGEPGTGKSQLARAAAQRLGRAFVSTVVDARTESRDLQWTLDAVRRLADAQLLSAVGGKGLDVRRELDELKYVSPGPLWWAFDWTEAAKQARNVDEPVPMVPRGCKAENGVVLLIDEIDKADSSVPNGLLESLGHGQFKGPGRVRIECGEPLPLVVITTNEERSLPDAFLRRCLVLQLRVREGTALRPWLIERGRAHARKWTRPVAEPVYETAAKLLERDRGDARRLGLSPPGVAEYLDLLRAVVHYAETEADQEDILDEISEFALRKHPSDDPT